MWGKLESVELVIVKEKPTCNQKHCLELFVDHK